ncbi:DNA repair protein RecO [Humisphaera borealis]|uniref:DNA repair protein RecO n=1 Tax=Humisphaera borealis TaxID=2807512 RepID=A0A7M2WYE6_9BACT|nr:DNA repair protein RecO [Humisphaera borealis]QOV90384.1 DNA repair protein RecO [Humisphaera borealis]
MPLVRDRCICLRITEYSETSQIVTLLSRDVGVVRAIAKGAHRKTKAGAGKFDGGMDYLEVGEAVFIFDPAKEMATLTEWTLREGHLALRNTLRGIYLALYAGELVDRLFELHDPHPEVFDRLESTLPLLATDRREQAFLALELEVLRESGYLAELDICVECGRPAGGTPMSYFSAKLGGVVCRDCEAVVPDRRTIDNRLVRIVQGILKLPRHSGTTLRLPFLTRHQTDPINRMLADHVQHTLGRGLAMGRWVLGNS